MTPPGHHHLPPAGTRTIELTYTHRHHILDGEEEPQFWHVRADARTGEAEPSLHHVGDLGIVRVNPYHTDTFAVLDSHSADLALIAETVLDLHDGGLHPDLEARMEPHGNDLLILDRIELAPAWHGSIGALITGLALKHLSGGCQAALCHPCSLGQTDDRSPVTWGAAATATSSWSQLGFEHFRDGVHVLDLALVTLDQAIDRLRRQHTPNR